METETLYCVKGHTYDRKWRNPGEAVTVRRRHSKVLIALGRMSREPSNVIPFQIKTEKMAETPTEGHTGVSPEVASVDENFSPDDVRAALRAEYKALFGKDAHGRTSVGRLREEIAKKKGESE